MYGVGVNGVRRGDTGLLNSEEGRMRLWWIRSQEQRHRCLFVPIVFVVAILTLKFPSWLADHLTKQPRDAVGENRVMHYHSVCIFSLHSCIKVPFPIVSITVVQASTKATETPKV